VNKIVMLAVTSFVAFPLSVAGAQGAQGEAPKPAVSETPTSLDAGLRTFAGPCLIEPKGEREQAGFLGAAVAALVPQIVSGGIDALTAALDAAGQDRVTSTTAVIPLEYRPRCIQVARGVTITSDKGNEEIKTALLNAPFLVEFYLRQSRDGSAVTVMPTVLNYGQTIDGKRTGTRARDLYATLELRRVDGTAATAVSVPLGSYAPDPRAGPHYFDPVAPPRDAAAHYSAGSAATPWIKSPFAPPAGGAPAPVPSDEEKRGESSSPPAAAGPRMQIDLASLFAPAELDPPGWAFAEQEGRPQPPSPRNPDDFEPAPESNTGFKPGGGGAPAGSRNARPGDPIAPVHVSIVFRETLKGSSFARFLSGILKGGKQKLVDAADPAKQAEARTTELNSWKTNMSAYATALADYYKKRTAYCTPAPSAPAELDARTAAAADLLASQVNLVAAAKIAEEQPPFTVLVTPGEGSLADCEP
jgi:hypothetical protein